MSTSTEYAQSQSTLIKKAHLHLTVITGCRQDPKTPKLKIVRVKRSRHQLDTINDDSSVAYSFSGLSILLGGAGNE